VALLEVNDPPIAVADTAAVATGQSVTIPVLANDTDPEGDPLVLTGFRAGPLGTVRREGNTLVYTPRIVTGGTDTVTYTIADGRGGTATGSVTVTIQDLAAPTVQAVRVTYGTVGVADLGAVNRTVLPWANIRRVSVVFSEDVTVAAGNLVLTGPGGPVPATFQYNPATRTATWTPLVPLGPGRWTVYLSAAGIADAGGNLLAADWAKTVGVLPGDFNGDGAVTDADLTGIRRYFGTKNPYADIDGNGLVNLADYNLAKANKSWRLL
jgi:hypothetical protein